MQLSPHFSLEEMTRTNTGLPNEPSQWDIDALTRLCEQVLEPMREVTGGALHVNSGYRSPEVNRHVGGVPTSQHTRGEAADVSPRDITPAELFDRTRKSTIPYDQLILEFGWVHASCAPLGLPPRRQVLRARKLQGGMIAYDQVSNG